VALFEFERAKAIHIPHMICAGELAPDTCTPLQAWNGDGRIKSPEPSWSKPLGSCVVAQRVRLGKITERSHLDDSLVPPRYHEVKDSIKSVIHVQYLETPQTL